MDDVTLDVYVPYFIQQTILYALSCLYSKIYKYIFDYKMQVYRETSEVSEKSVYKVDQEYCSKSISSPSIIYCDVSVFPTRRKFVRQLFLLLSLTQRPKNTVGDIQIFYLSLNHSLERHSLVRFLSTRRPRVSDVINHIISIKTSLSCVILLLIFLRTNNRKLLLVVYSRTNYY